MNISERIQGLMSFAVEPGFAVGAGLPHDACAARVVSRLRGTR